MPAAPKRPVSDMKTKICPIYTCARDRQIIVDNFSPLLSLLHYSSKFLRLKILFGNDLFDTDFWSSENYVTTPDTRRAALI